MPACPVCEGTEFEARGDVRVYVHLDADLEPDGWHYGDDIDYDDADEPPYDLTVYCLSCDSEFARGELLGVS